MKTIIEMAREAGIEVTYDPTETPTRAFAECWIEDLEHFAALVRADEREACAKVAEQKWYEGVASVGKSIRARGNT